MGKFHQKTVRDNRANQLNPSHSAYYRSRGASSSEAANSASRAKVVLDNRANQLNPNDVAYKTSRGGEVYVGQAGAADSETATQGRSK